MSKKLFIKLALIAIPIVAIILFVNIKVDSGFVIRNRNPEIAKILVSGKNAAVKFIPAKWGSLQTAIINEEIKQPGVQPKDILVFGPSNSSEIDGNLFPGKTFFNCVLPGGNILDIIAMYGLYKQHNLLPKAHSRCSRRPSQPSRPQISF